MGHRPGRAYAGSRRGRVTTRSGMPGSTLPEGLVAAISTDAENVYITLSARALNPELRIAARASADQAEDKLRTAGASTVLDHRIRSSATRLAQSLLRPHVLSFLDVASAFSKTSDKDLENRSGVCVRFQRSGFQDVGGIRNPSSVWRHRPRDSKKPSEGMLFNPASDTRIDAGDFLIAMGEGSDLKKNGDGLRTTSALNAKEISRFSLSLQLITSLHSPDR